ncbi:MAG TPA: hypothetical protein VFV81_02915, partial [Verrucomicrobiae bacterium]|nr:hypothetical protein [Verrucomicrobiae bacterium]
MKTNPPLNGSDQLMRGFDFESRRHGFAGNHCQILLEIDGPVSVEHLQTRLASLQARYPILHSRVGGLLLPRWKRRRPATVPVRLQPPGAEQSLFNQP